MKYIIIPLFRIITLPILMVYIFIVIISFILIDLWNWDFYDLEYLLNRTSFYSYERYNKCGGDLIEQYHYKTLWHYIINKKSYGKESL